MEQKNGSSWGFVITMLLLFPPIGLYLLFRNLKSGNTPKFNKGKIVFGIGVFFSIYGVLILLLLSTGSIEANKDQPTVDESFKQMTTFFLISGVVLMIIGSIMKKIILKREQMASHNRNYSGYSTPNFRNGDYSYVKTETIIFSDNSTDQSSSPQEKVVRCEGCGARNVITQGKVTECEYCRTPLQ